MLPLVLLILDRLVPTPALFQRSTDLTYGRSNSDSFNDRRHEIVISRCRRPHFQKALLDDRIVPTRAHLLQPSLLGSFQFAKRRRLHLEWRL